MAEPPATQDIIAELNSIGWDAKVRESGGAFVASGTGPYDLKAKAQGPSEGWALVGLLNRARAQNNVFALSRTVGEMDPNQDPPDQSLRIGRDAITLGAHIASSMLNLHDSWWDKDLRIQEAKLEDVIRMADMDLSPDQARRMAEIDLSGNRGRGHVFRAYAAEQGESPRAASAAWFLLAPLSSQLAIDLPHVREGRYTSHWHYERAILAARHHHQCDHIPLGLFCDLIGKNPSIMHVAQEHIDETLNDFEQEIAAHTASVHLSKITSTNETKMRKWLADHKGANGRKFGKWAGLNFKKITVKEFEKFLDKEVEKMPWPRSREFEQDAMDAFKLFRQLPEIFRSGIGIIGD